MTTLQLSISNLAWDPQDNEEIAQFLNRHEIHWIDLAPGKFLKGAALTDQAAIARERAWWRERGFSFAGMQSLLFGTSELNVFGDSQVQTRLLKHLEQICVLAAELELKPLVFGSPRNRDRSGLSDAQAQDMALEFFDRLGELARQHGVIICLEPNAPQYGTNFLVTTAEAVAFVQTLNHPAVKVQIDTGTIWANHEAPEQLTAALLWAGHIHLSEPGLKPLGAQQTGTDYATVAAQLKDWTRPITIEMLTSAPAAAPHEITAALELVTAALQGAPTHGA